MIGGGISKPIFLRETCSICKIRAALPENTCCWWCFQSVLSKRRREKLLEANEEPEKNGDS